MKFFFCLIKGAQDGDGQPALLLLIRIWAVPADLERGQRLLAVICESAEQKRMAFELRGAAY